MTFVVVPKSVLPSTKFYNLHKFSLLVILWNGIHEWKEDMITKTQTIHALLDPLHDPTAVG